MTAAAAHTLSVTAMSASAAGRGLQHSPRPSPPSARRAAAQLPRRRTATLPGWGSFRGRPGWESASLRPVVRPRQKTHLCCPLNQASSARPADMALRHAHDAARKSLSQAVCFGLAALVGALGPRQALSLHVPSASGQGGAAASTAGDWDGRWSVVPISGDGNCLYRAVAQARTDRLASLLFRAGSAVHATCLCRHAARRAIARRRPVSRRSAGRGAPRGTPFAAGF